MIFKFIFKHIQIDLFKNTNLNIFIYYITNPPILPLGQLMLFILWKRWLKLPLSFSLFGWFLITEPPCSLFWPLWLPTMYMAIWAMSCTPKGFTSILSGDGSILRSITIYITSILRAIMACISWSGIAGWERFVKIMMTVMSKWISSGVRARILSIFELVNIDWTVWKRV